MACSGPGRSEYVNLQGGLGAAPSPPQPYKGWGEGAFALSEFYLRGCLFCLRDLVVFRFGDAGQTGEVTASNCADIRIQNAHCVVVTLSLHRETVLRAL